MAAKETDTFAIARTHALFNWDVDVDTRSQPNEIVLFVSDIPNYMLVEPRIRSVEWKTKERFPTEGAQAEVQIQVGFEHHLVASLFGQAEAVVALVPPKEDLVRAVVTSRRLRAWVRVRDTGSVTQPKVRATVSVTPIPAALRFALFPLRRQLHARGFRAIVAAIRRADDGCSNSFR